MMKFRRKHRECFITVGFTCIVFTSCMMLLKALNLSHATYRNMDFDETASKDSLFKTYMDNKYTTAQRILPYKQLEKIDESKTRTARKITVPIMEPNVNRQRPLHEIRGLNSFVKLKRPFYLAMLSLWRDFTKFCDILGFPFILYGGTLLGSYRHHGFVPWDDDLDVLMNVSYRVPLFLQFSKLPGYQIVPIDTTAGSYYYKFFKLPRGARRTQQYSDGTWAFYWPFVDIFFFEENSTHITDISWHMYSSELYTWKKEKFLPLKKRPLEGRLYNVPCDMRYVLKSDIDICISSWYDHIRSKSLQSTAVMCQDLFRFYPFVRRETGSSTEILMVNETIINTVVFKEGCP